MMMPEAEEGEGGYARELDQSSVFFLPSFILQHLLPPLTYHGKGGMVCGFLSFSPSLCLKDLGGKNVPGSVINSE